MDKLTCFCFGSSIYHSLLIIIPKKLFYISTLVQNISQHTLLIKTWVLLRKIETAVLIRRANAQERLSPVLDATTRRYTDGFF
jgi:hypothetical protein